MTRARSPAYNRSMSDPVHPILIGCCGWSYPEWEGVFYPAGLAAGEYLEWYADRFPIVMVRDGLDGRRWFRSSRLVSPRWRVRGDLDPDSLAHGMLHGGDAENASPRKVGADAWFEFRGCQDEEVREQSFRSTADEIITIVTVPEAGLA